MTGTLGDPNQPWHEHTSDEIGEAAAGSTFYEYLPVKQPTLIQFTGECPVCTHSFVYEHPLESLRQVEPEPVIVLCSCTASTHTGRPEKWLGCGAYWQAGVTP